MKHMKKTEYHLLIFSSTVRVQHQLHLNPSKIVTVVKIIKLLDIRVYCNVYIPVLNVRVTIVFLWPPYVRREAIIFLPCGFYLLLILSSSSSSFFFSSPNLSGRRLDVYHTSAPGVALVRI